jgi:hypothetical protein
VKYLGFSFAFKGEGFWTTQDGLVLTATIVVVKTALNRKVPVGAFFVALLWQAL